MQLLPTSFCSVPSSPCNMADALMILLSICFMEGWHASLQSGYVCSMTSCRLSMLKCMWLIMMRLLCNPSVQQTSSSVVLLVAEG